MKTLKAAVISAVALGAAAIAGAASAYPVVVAGPGPYVYAPRPVYPVRRVVVAPPPYYAAAPVWVGGVYYGYPYYWHGARYYGPRGFGYRHWR